LSPSFLSDHSPTEITINLEEFKRGKGFWKLNCSLLKDRDYVDLIKKTIIDTVKDNRNIDDVLLWEMIKLQVRGNSIKYSSRKKRSNNNILSALQKRLKRLTENFDENPNSEIKEDIHLINGDIEQIIEHEIKGAQIRAKLNWLNEGERPTIFFLNFEKQNANKKHIKRIITQDGNIITGKESVLLELESFYRLLYRRNRKPGEPKPNFSNTLGHLHIPKLSDIEGEECEDILTESELLAALKTTTQNKSPGNDGLPSEFYKVFWKDIKQYLINALNASYNNRKLSITQRQGIITLLPKKDRNILKLKSWRPITLLNQDSKLATKAIASRICKYLPNIIHPDQTGFIKGRYIGENIFKILNILEYIDEENIEALLINIDFEKAFDNLEWDFIDYCLKTFNFGESLRQWITTFYTDVECCVLNNGWTTPIFQLSKGARQGCPLSSYIFIICAELLACLIRQNQEIEGLTINGNYYVISQYADDTNIFIKYSEKSLGNVINSFRTYQTISGLKVNLDKTEIVPLGPIKQHYNILLEGEQLRWTTDPIRCLGIIICTDKERLIDLNYIPIITKMNRIIQFWNKQHMTTFGKVVIINSFLISQLVYLMSVLPTPPTQIIKQIDAQLYTFLWSNKTERIKRVILQNTKQSGGVSMPDIILKDKGLTISWAKRLVQSNYLAEFMYISTWITNIDIWKCNLNPSDINVLFRKKPNKFNRDIFSAWSYYSYNTPDTSLEIMNQFIWFNSHIRIDGKPTFNNRMYTAGIK
jgi:hypothetical protein